MAICTVILKEFLRYLLGTLWKETLRLEEVSSHVGKVFMARNYEFLAYEASKDRRQPLERMWTCNYNQQKDQSCNHKEITSTKAE
ncbi:D-amino acid oxidase regulator isoform 5 [Homo sapiens]|uniref:D-amino acid oxidase regulator isoform 5 n=1 Tax=Homo sapiens TaxID=9606 RepID=UPI00001FCA68|nr:D-amino acid oxidase activator isoform 5 [Homo sapiens]